MHDPGSYTEAFEREHGCALAQWLDSLPGAVGAHALELAADSASARVRIGAGTLELRWTVLAPRRIALVQTPRMAVRYRFHDVAQEARVAFMRYFDLFMQRGGG
ncbi:MAG TPA: hypothetical protein VFU71_12400 [Burkholderiaceae bacterium]|nr:hypothetical protein [Burkholderiaceae bacterium]